MVTFFVEKSNRFEPCKTKTTDEEREFCGKKPFATFVKQVELHWLLEGIAVVAFT